MDKKIRETKCYQLLQQITQDIFLINDTPLK